MKLNDIQIQQFGKLKEKKIFLEDGINVIYGPNESGKYYAAWFYPQHVFWDSPLSGKGVKDGSLYPL